MTPEADRLLAVALKRVDVRDGFSPVELGARIGLSKPQAETAARALADAGVLVLGFDHSAEFSLEFRKSKSARAAPPPSRKKRSTRPPLAE